MSSRYFNEAGPWSLFIPVMLAVALGILIAQGVAMMIGMVFPQGPVAVRSVDVSPAAIVPSAVPVPQAPAAVPAVSSRTDMPQAAPALREEAVPSAMSTMPDAQMPDVSADVSSPPAADDGIRRLKGPTGARQNGEAEACISGTVALRATNGWEQQIDEQQPQPCVATSS